MSWAPSVFSLKTTKKCAYCTTHAFTCITLCDDHHTWTDWSPLTGIGRQWVRNEFNKVFLYSCSPRWVIRKLWTVYETVSCILHAAVTQMLCIETLLLRARFVMMTVPGIKLCAIAAYHLFHSHAQVLTFIDSTKWTGVYINYT